MKKNSLLKQDNTIIRILEVKDNEILIINCTKREMPKWVYKLELCIEKGYNLCTEEELYRYTDIYFSDFDSLDNNSKKIAYERYNIISGILPFIGEKQYRNYAIDKIATDNNITKQTVRKYLCQYLIYQNLSVLAPMQTEEKQLSKDEKNMRWALNKFYYTKHKNSLTTAYTLMIKEKYCDSLGNLLPEYPSIHQFKYFYKKYNKMQTLYITREGIKGYQRNHRPLLGEGIQEFAPAIGTAMLDTTICDIYLVNDSGNLVGRPILTACIDAYSGLCCGYNLTWEGGMYSLRNLMTNIVTDKVEHCKQFGITIVTEDWDCNKMPSVLVTDMGAEYKSQNFDQLAELGIKIINLPPYRPELKGAVEKFFDLVQNTYKKHLKGKGVIEPDFQERGSHDYRKDACLTMRDFEKIIIHCIIYYNSKRIIENFPYTQDMINNNIQPYSSTIWNYNKDIMPNNLIAVDVKTLQLTLLPRTTGKFNRDGLKVNKLRYKHKAYTESYLKGDTVTVAYNPDNVSEVWLIDKGNYIKFDLIESRFKDKELSETFEIRNKQKELVKASVKDNLQAQIDLAEHINVIANVSNRHNTNIKDIRNTRNKEITRTHISFGGVVNV